MKIFITLFSILLTLALINSCGSGSAGTSAMSNSTTTVYNSFMITRSNTAWGTSLTDLDGICQTNFGSNYIAGSIQDYVARVKPSILASNSFCIQSYSTTADRSECVHTTTSSGLVSINTTNDSGPVLCIYKAP